MVGILTPSVARPNTLDVGVKAVSTFSCTVGLRVVPAPIPVHPPHPTPATGLFGPERGLRGPWGNGPSPGESSGKTGGAPRIPTLRRRDRGGSTSGPVTPPTRSHKGYGVSTRQGVRPSTPSSVEVGCTRVVDGGLRGFVQGGLGGCRTRGGEHTHWVGGVLEGDGVKCTSSVPNPSERRTRTDLSPTPEPESGKLGVDGCPRFPMGRRVLLLRVYLCFSGRTGTGPHRPTGKGGRTSVSSDPKTPDSPVRPSVPGVPWGPGGEGLKDVPSSGQGPG